jgi:UDP-sulfoquinovose synthase
VYGQETPQTALDDRLATRFDYDAIFGTVLNRFVVQSVLGEPLTVYGGGGQTRGVIDIRDTVECLRLTSEQPADPGEFRVFNQMTESFNVTEIARVVATSYPGEASIENIENPRVEAETHYYNVVHSGLVGLGLTPHCLSETLITSMFDVAERYKHRVDREALLPLVNWRRTTNRVRPAEPQPDWDADWLVTPDR